MEGACRECRLLPGYSVGKILICVCDVTDILPVSDWRCLYAYPHLITDLCRLSGFFTAQDCPNSED